MSLSFFLFPIGTLFFYLGHRFANRSSIFQLYIPVDTIAKIPFGVPIVVKGTIESEQPLTAPLSHKPCVYYHYIVEQQVKEYDRSGTIRIVWKPAGTPLDHRIPFLLQDQSGSTIIRPDNARLDAPVVTETLANPLDLTLSANQNPSFLGQTLQAASAIFGVQNRIRETILPIGATVNVFGILSLEGSERFLQTTNQFPLAITTLSKEQLTQSEKVKSYFCYGLAIAIFFLGIYFLLNF
ncbi:MAG: GIDE domain-containing protein [Caldilineaceae bacterium]